MTGAADSSSGMRRAAILVVVVGGIAIAVGLGSDLFSPAHTKNVLAAIDAVSRGVAVYAGTNAGQIPKRADLLAELTGRGTAPDLNPAKMGGYSIDGVTRLSANRYRVLVTCPATEDGRAGCKQIIAARAPGAFPNVLAVDGGGTTNVSIDFRL